MEDSKKNRKNKSKRLKKYPKIGGMSATKWNGAGIFLIEKYKLAGKKTRIPCLILFGQWKPVKNHPHNKYKYVYEEGGGGKDPGEKPWITAARELKEESCNLFRLDKNKVQSCPSILFRGYICYSVNIESDKGIFSKNYYFNRDKIKNWHKNFKNVPHEWRETDNMTRIPLSSFMTNDGKPNSRLKVSGDFKVNDINGKTIYIEGRCKRCILASIEKGTIFTAPIFKLRFESSFDYNKSPAYLKGTKTYYN